METLRSSYALDETPVFLQFCDISRRYKLTSRWDLIVSFEKIKDATDAFEALCLIDAPITAITGKFIKVEVKRLPITRMSNSNAMARINEIIHGVEKRTEGLRPIKCGKGTYKWIQA